MPKDDKAAALAAKDAPLAADAPAPQDKPVDAPKPPKPATVSTAKPASELAIAHSAPHNYSDMAKIAAGLLVGVLALMVFLLSVGLQHPKPLIQEFLYVSLASLGLSLIFYQIGVIVEAGALAKGTAPAARRSLGVVRIMQQLVFTVAIVSTVGFAIVASQLFFVTPQTQGQTQTQTQQQQ